MINVWGDSIGAGIVAHLSKREVADYISKNESNEIIDVVSFKDQSVNKAYLKDENEIENTTEF
jgi:hypothetical protein